MKVLPLELARTRWEVPSTARERVRRTGSRAALLGHAVVLTALRLRELRAGDGAARERARVLREASRRALELHGVEVSWEGPLPLGPALLAANHVSWLDPLVVASLVPLVPVAKADLAAWPVVGALARELGVLFVRRGDARSGTGVLRAARAALEDGLPVLNFPEGTTTRGDGVKPFRHGLFGVARALGVPVHPVALAYDPPELAWVGDDRFLPHWLGLAGERRARATVRVGPAVDSAAHETPQRLAAAVRRDVLRLLGLDEPGGTAGARDSDQRDR